MPSSRRYPMGTCISTKNSIRVSDISAPKDNHGNKVEKIEAIIHDSEKNHSNKLSIENLVNTEKNDNVSQDLQSDLRIRTKSFSDNSNGNKEIDSIVKMHLEEFISDSSEDESSILEDGNMLWIPFSMAQHMGVTRRATLGDYLDQRDRIYGNDEDLFMSVETNMSHPLSGMRPNLSFVTHLAPTSNEENINNNKIQTDQSPELRDAEIQGFEDNWISIKVDR